jgi:hypothetical protein|tara:strand:- start:242 stop:451 length:210 start_codon:yes stop_codon:yes gene_type:complete
MFKIYAMICMLNVGALDQTLCFKSEVPLQFNDNLECNMSKNQLADYLDADLRERKLTVIFKCGNEGSNV